MFRVTTKLSDVQNVIHLHVTLRMSKQIKSVFTPISTIVRAIKIMATKRMFIILSHNRVSYISTAYRLKYISKSTWCMWHAVWYAAWHVALYHSVLEVLLLMWLNLRGCLHILYWIKMCWVLNRNISKVKKSCALNGETDTLIKQYSQYKPV
jgi:hypothetical protein